MRLAEPLAPAKSLLPAPTPPPAPRVVEPSPPRATEKAGKIGYAVTATDDGPFIDGAAVLAHSVLTTHERSRYGVELLAFVSPRVGLESRRALQTVGFSRILERTLPINVTRIKGKRLREQWSKDSRKGGCCGAWELLKLYAWTLIEYHRVVHVDMDCMLLQPIDELFVVDAPLVYTADYNMMSARLRRRNVTPAVQGGFLVIRPSLPTFHALVAVEQEGLWDGAWPGGIGAWWGGSTIQGLLPYYFATKADEPAVEVDRCTYDNMVDKPVLDPPPRVGASACRSAKLSDVKFVHFTVCQKPWSCHPARTPDDRDLLCVNLHRKWFEFRRQVESKLGLEVAQRPCKNGYTPINFLHR